MLGYVIRYGAILLYKRETEGILMDKKPSNVNFVIRLTVILAFFAIALFPMCLMALDGPERPDASMQEDTITLVAPTPGNYITGKFQTTFESWLSKYYPLRSSIVTQYKQMQMDIENSGAVIGIMNTLKGEIPGMGDQGTTCEQHVDDDYNGVCDVCATKLYDVPIGPGDSGNEGGDSGNEGGDSGNEGGDNGNQGGNTTPPVNVYLDPSNIYAQINRLQLLNGTPKEPTGFKGDSGIKIGKSGYLYEYTYIDEYLGVSGTVYTQVTDAGMQEMVDKMEYIQAELKKRGIEMLYVITSSKASAYADYIPEHYKNSVTTVPGYVRPIERLRTMLANSSIHYLDSAKYYEEIGLLVTFPKTGIHWNALASFESTAKLITMYQELSGKKTVTLKATGVQTSMVPPSSFNNEQDIFNILYNRVDASYRESAIKDDAYYAPEIAIENKNANKFNVLVQGGSFAHSIVHYMRNYGVANVTQVYYNDFGNTGRNPWTEGPEAWEGILAGKNLIIFEATEQQIRGGHKTSSMTWEAAASNGHLGHNAVYDSLYEYLKAHEGEY